MIAVMIALLPPAHRIIRAEEAGDTADERGALPLTPVIKFWLVPNCRPHRAGNRSASDREHRTRTRLDLKLLVHEEILEENLRRTRTRGRARAGLGRGNNHGAF
jgi:hypothetical protein